MISHKYKFIFVHINKTAGTSIDETLQCHCENYNKHESLRELKEQALSNDYFKFTFVRNSWDRFISLYKFRVKTNQTGLGENPIPFKDCSKKIYHKDSKYYNISGERQRLMLSTQLDWITDGSGNIALDFIGRFENLQEDFNTICDKIGIPQQQLPHRNKTEHKHYTEYYNDETRQIVAEKYAKDIEYFGYEFGE